MAGMLPKSMIEGFMGDGLSMITFGSVFAMLTLFLKCWVEADLKMLCSILKGVPVLGRMLK